MSSEAQQNSIKKVTSKGEVVAIGSNGKVNVLDGPRFSSPVSSLNVPV